MTTRYDHDLTKEEVRSAYTSTLAAANRVTEMNFGTHEEPATLAAQLEQMRLDLEQALTHVRIALSLVKASEPIPTLKVGKPDLRVVK